MANPRSKEEQEKARELAKQALELLPIPILNRHFSHAMVTSWRAGKSSPNATNMKRLREMIDAFLFDTDSFYNMFGTVTDANRLGYGIVEHVDGTKKIKAHNTVAFYEFVVACQKQGKEEFFLWELPPLPKNTMLRRMDTLYGLAPKGVKPGRRGTPTRYYLVSELRQALERVHRLPVATFAAAKINEDTSGGWKTKRPTIYARQ